MVTQIIHGYWAQGRGNGPEVVERCWAAWERLNPGWRVQVLDQADADRIFDRLGLGARPDGVQSQSDIVRLYQIVAEGGVYVDAATVPVLPLDGWLPEVAETGFFAFHDPYRRRMVENWFLYADPGNAVAQGWLDAVGRHWAQPRRPMIQRRECEPGWRGAVARWQGARHKGTAKEVIEPRNRLASVDPARGGRFGVHPYFGHHYLFDLMLEQEPEIAAAWARMPKLTSYKDLMLRHWKRHYDRLTPDLVDSIVAGSRMQKLALKTLPDAAVLDRILPRT